MDQVHSDEQGDKLIQTAFDNSESRESYDTNETPPTLKTKERLKDFRRSHSEEFINMNENDQDYGNTKAKSAIDPNDQLEIDFLINQAFLTGLKNPNDERELSDLLLTQQELADRSCFSKWFGSLTPGSMRGSIFALMATAIGAGVLSLPYVVKQSGLIIGVINLVGGACISYTSMRLLTWACWRTKCWNYSKLISDTFGPFHGTILSWVIMIWTLGSTVPYNIIMTQTFPLVFKAFGCPAHIADSDWFKYTQVVLLNLFLLPVCLLRDLSAMASFNFLGIFAIFYFVVLMVCETPMYMEHYFNKEELVLFDPNLTSFQGFAIAIFAYTCHTNLFAVKLELNQPIKRRLNKIFFRAVHWEMWMYLGISVGGYLSLLGDVPKIIINRKNIPGQMDWFMIAGQIAMIINLMTCLPTSVHPWRREIYVSHLKRKSTETEHFLITFFGMAGTATIATIYPDVINIFSLLGGFCAVPIVVVYPGYIYVMLSRKKWTHPKKLALIIVTTILSSMGFAAAFISLADLTGLIHLD